MNSLHVALHQFIRMSGESNSDYTELAAQLDVLQQCFTAGMTPEQIARLLTVLFNEADGYVNRAQYVRQELEFEVKLLATNLDRRTLAMQEVGETAGTDVDWTLCDLRAFRPFSQPSAL